MEEVKRMLFVYPHQMYPVSGGGVVRSLQILRYLVDQGWKVDLLTEKVNKPKLESLIGRKCGVIFYEEIENNAEVSPKERRMREKLPDLRSKSIYYRNYCPELIDSTRSLLNEGSYSHVFTNYLWTTDLLKEIPEEIVTIIDTHDLQYKRSRQFEKSGENVAGYTCSKSLELKKYKEADKIVCINREEYNILSKYFDEDKLILVPFVPERILYSKMGIEPFVLFVGNKYMPNEQGIRNFIENSWGMVLEKSPNARLLIVGKVGDSLDDYRGRSDIEITGRVESLDPYYAQSSVAIVPVSLGTGLKIKAVEALSYGKAIIIEKKSSGGIDYFENFPDQCASVGVDFAKKVAAILVSSGVRRNLECRAREYLDQGLSSSRYYEDLISRI